MTTQDAIYDIFALLDSQTLAKVQDARSRTALLPGYELLRKQTWLNDGASTTAERKQALLTAIQERIDALAAFRNSLLTQAVDDNLKDWFYETDGGKKLLEGWRAVLNADLETMLQLTSHAKLSTDSRDPAGGAIWSLLDTAGIPVRFAGWQGGSKYLSQTLVVIGDQALCLQHKNEQADSNDKFNAGVMRAEYVDGQYQFKEPNQDPAAANSFAKSIATKLRDHYSVKTGFTPPAE